MPNKRFAKTVVSATSIAGRGSPGHATLINRKYGGMSLLASAASSLPIRSAFAWFAVPAAFSRRYQLLQQQGLLLLEQFADAFGGLFDSFSRGLARFVHYPSGDAFAQIDDGLFRGWNGRL